QRAPDPEALVAELRAVDEAARAGARARAEAAAVARSAGGAGAVPRPRDDDAEPARRPADDLADDDAGTQHPADGLALVRDALRTGSTVIVEVAGHTGRLERRELKPLRLDGGRLRALDPDREAELTIAVHRIASVLPTSAP